MRRVLASLLLAAATAAPAAAETRSFRADYSVTLLGLPVAKARFDSPFDGGRFSIEGSMSSSGIARIFDDTKGTTKVEGSIRRDRVQPHAFESSYVTGRKKSATSIRFSGDRVASAVNTPQPRRDPKSWIPVSAGDLRAALDPISSSLVPAARPEEVCERTIRFFDGEMRGDLRLSHRSGPERGRVTCDARFVPVAGYRKGRKQIEFMKSSPIRISFAPLGDTGLYTPVEASVGTQIGTLRITASRIEAR